MSKSQDLENKQSLEKIGFFRSLQGRLAFWFLLIALLPLGTVETFNYLNYRNNIYLDAVDKLSAARDIKASHVEAYFNERLSDARFLAQAPLTSDALAGFEWAVEDSAEASFHGEENRNMADIREYYTNKTKADSDEVSKAYQKIHDDFHGQFKRYLEAYGYYDIFLAEPHSGTIVYSVMKEVDFGTSLKTGPYASSNIGEAFSKAVKTTDRDAVFLEDFAYYEPSKEAAAFSAAPVFDGDKLMGVLIFQLSVKQINAIMQNRAGMGDTGETLLISSEDFLLRSDSRFFEHSTLLKQKADTAATRASAAGEKGVKEITDYRGVETLIAHTPLNIPGLRWSLNAKIDSSEAFAPIHQSLKNTLWAGGGAAILVLFMAFLISTSIASPLRALTRFARNLSEGNLGQRIDIVRTDEIGLLANSFREMGGNLNKVIDDASRITQSIAQGHLDVSPEAEYKGDFIRFKDSFSATTANLRKIINDLVSVLESLAKGRLDASPKADYDGNFIHIKQALTTALPNLRDVIQDIVSVSGELAKGNHHIRPEADYRGDFNEIRLALTDTALNLASAAERSAAEDWMKDGQAGLSRCMSGEQDMTKLGRNIVRFIAKHVEIPMGALFLLKGEATDKEKARLQLVAAYAYTWRKSLSNEFKIGQGLIGQAAMERRPIVINDASEAFVPVQSGLGTSPPRHVYIIPILHEGVLKGVLELASFHQLDQTRFEFLKISATAVGLALNSTESRLRTQELLEQSQAQAEELQSQSEELQNQSEELQSQNEEMQSQAEELRQTNEELEERTQALERQQAAIRQQNLDLEQARAGIETKAKELEIASKYKSEFLANMSHELRTPLNSLLILSQLLSNNKEGNLTQKQIDSARTIHSAGSDLLKLINEILDLSKVEAGKIELNLEDIQLSVIKQTVEEKFCHMAEDKGLEFRVNIGDNIPPVLHNDEQRLQQVINNLISNAFKFTDKGGAVTLNIRRPAADTDLSRSGLKREESIEVSVSDSGIGIPKEKQMLIFEAFQQADGTTSRKYGGTGLGLSISRQLAQLMGGEIQLHSEAGKGSTFSIYLPEHWTSGKESGEANKAANEALPADEPPITVPTVAPPPIASGTDGTAKQEETQTANLPASLKDDRDDLKEGDKSILVVEDDPEFARILIELAHEQDFRCLYAGDGANGLELAAKYQPSAILLDIGLPQMDGWSVMEHLKDNPSTRHIPVHFISGADEQHDAKRMGAIGYLLKPVNTDDLNGAFQRIEQHIEHTLKTILLITDDEQRQQDIENLLGGGDIQITQVKTAAQAKKALTDNKFDCLVLTIHEQKNKGVKLLEQIKDHENLADIPVILHADRELTETEENILQNCSKALVVKEVHSRERLLDETTLFLHQVESKLSSEQRQLLKRAHDKEAILAGKKVLLVDDDMRNIFALAAILEEKDMSVLTATNGYQALEILAKESSSIALVLMDIMMPEMDGYEAMQKIREQAEFRKLPIIALTAKAMKGDRAKCIEAGANDYLSKPIDSDKLLSLMRVWLYR